MVPRDLHLTLQPQTQAIRSSLQRTLQDPVCGWQRHWLSQECVRLRAFESGARQTAHNQAAAFRLAMEQLRGISQKAEKTGTVGCGWIGYWQNTAYPRTVLPDERNSRKGWNCGGPLRMERNLRASPG